MKDETRFIKISYDEKLTELDKMILSSYGTYTNFAKQIGIPMATLQHIRRSPMRNIKMCNVLKICKGLHLSIDDFVKLTQELELF